MAEEIPIVERVQRAQATAAELVKISRWNMLQAAKERGRAVSRRRMEDADAWDEACDAALL